MVSEAASRVLVITPTGRDAAMVTQFLLDNQLESVECPTIRVALAEAEKGVGAFLVAEEALDPPGIDALAGFRATQESWSDVPLLVLTRRGDGADRQSWSKWFRSFGTVTTLERPIGKGPLLSAVQSALQDRRRQYESRDQMSELERIGRELQTANVRKDELLALVSHELRTPLTGILGCSRLLARRSDTLTDDDKAGLFSDLEEHGARLRRVIENMLVLSHAETTNEVNAEPVLAQRILPLLVNELSPLRDSRSLLLTMDTDLPPMLVNPVFLDQILRNLVRNSEKYSAEGEPVEITVTADDQTVSVTVADRGEQFEQERVVRFFDAFYRDPGSARRTDGLGLGLPVCRRLAEVQGAKISGRPRRGGGLLVTLDFPVAADLPEAD